MAPDRHIAGGAQRARGVQDGGLGGLVSTEVWVHWSGERRRFGDGSRCFRLALDTLRSCFSSNSGISLPLNSTEAGKVSIVGRIDRADLNAAHNECTRKGSGGDTKCTSSKATVNSQRETLEGVILTATGFV